MMTMEEALCQLDCENSIEAMHKDINNHINQGHWKVVLKYSITLEQKEIPILWSMK